MSIDRRKMYKFPWSKTDNPGSWIEVTDKCDLFCPGCYRHTLEGHRSLEEVKKDILASKKMTNCDRIAIAGGEPLIYPHILEVVDFIHRQKMKPMILTNGEKLTWELASALKKAGLVQFYFHVDSNQGRPGWTDKNENEMNKLRQRLADLVWELGGVQCGFNVTVFRSALEHIPEIMEWCRVNVHKVQHLSLITNRGILIADEVRYMVNGKEIDLDQFKSSSTNSEEINITTDEMFEILESRFPDFRPCAYLNGTAWPETYKFLMAIHLGTKNKVYGVLGRKTVELAQILHHLVKGKYSASLGNPKVGKKIFILSLLDRELRKTFFRFLKESFRNPLRIFDSIYIQCINLQQPNEVFRGETNLCDGCVNMMVYRGELVNSCKLDEYRMFGGPIQPLFHESSKNIDNG